VDDVLTMMQERIPIFSSVNALLFRELILDSTVHVFNEGDVVFERDDYTNSFYTVLEGGIKTVITEDLIISSAVGRLRVKVACYLVVVAQQLCLLAINVY